MDHSVTCLHLIIFYLVIKDLMHIPRSQNVLFWGLTRPELDLFLETSAKCDYFFGCELDSKVIFLICVKGLVLILI